MVAQSGTVEAEAVEVVATKVTAELLKQRASVEHLTNELYENKCMIAPRQRAAVATKLCDYCGGGRAAGRSRFRR